METPRLKLRAFRLTDAPYVQALAGARAIADTTLNIPHPYEDGMAEDWIRSLGPEYDAGVSATFAIERRDNQSLVGAIGLKLDRQNNKGDLGYWIGQPFWNYGYATEAAAALIAFGFDDLDLNRISAGHFVRNPASGRVMEKAGMKPEGVSRQDVVKWGKYEDLAFYGVLRQDWLKDRS